MGIFGLILNIILLFISSLIPCGKDNYYNNFCSSIKIDNSSEENNNSKGNSSYYFDNFLDYIANIKGDLFPKDPENLKI